MLAVLRRGRSLRIDSIGKIFEPGKPVRLASSREAVYLHEAHGERVQVIPPLACYGVRKGQDVRRVERWELRRWQEQGWRVVQRPAGVETGGTVLVIRTMGLGDVLMLTPALGALHRELGSPVQVATYARYVPLLWGNKDVEAAYPIGTDYMPERFGACADLNWGPERHELAETVPRQDILAEMLGVKPEDRRPRYRIAASEQAWARGMVSSWARPIVGIQVHASCPTRSYPAALMAVLVGKLRKLGGTVVLLGEWDSIGGEAGVRDLVGRLSLRQLAAVIGVCDCLVCPDSGLLHLAEAVGTRYVGLFGPVPSWLRMSGYCAGVTVDGSAQLGCEPCFDRARCKHARGPACLWALTPEVICELVAEVLADTAT